METVAKSLAPLTMRHHLLVGVGNWGSAVNTVLARALDVTHPELVQANAWFNVLPEGVAWFDWLPTSIGNTHPTSVVAEAASREWIKSNADSAPYLLADVLKDASSVVRQDFLRRTGYEPLTGDASSLDIYLCARVDDPFAQSVLLQALNWLRQARPASLRVTFTFMLGVDSPQLKQLSPTERRACRTFITTLDKFLAREVRSRARSDDQIGWCYLADTLNKAGSALAPATPEPDGKRDAAQMLAEVTAGYLALLLTSEVRESKEYLNLALPTLTHGAHLDPSCGYCSTFSRAAYVLPIQDIVRRSARQLGAALLEPFDVERAPERSKAEDLVREFFVTQNLTRAVVEARLSKDERGQPLHFTIDPTQFDDAPDEAVVDRIRSWDTFIAKNRMAPLAEGLEHEADKLFDSAQSWIRNCADALVTRELYGVATARVFCDSLTRELHEQAQHNAKPVKPHGVLWHLFRRSEAHGSEPETIELEPYQHELQRALAARVERPAVWLRYVALALVEIAFAIPAWDYLQAALRVSLGSSLHLPFEWLDPWGLPLLILSFNALAAWLSIAKNESRISQARQRLLEMIQFKYDQAIRWNVLQKVSEIYGQLLATLEQERSALEHWSQATVEAARQLRTASPDNYAPLCLETALLAPEQYARFGREYSPAELDALFVAWLHVTPPRWREPEAGVARRSAYRYAEQEINCALATLSVEQLTDARKDQWALTGLVETLERRTRIQLALASTLPVKDLNLLGIEDREQTRLKTQLDPSAGRTLVSTRDPARLVYAPTAHGLPLRDLKIWENLK